MSLHYLLQISAIWAILYAFYYYWLRTANWPQFNRFYLLSSLLAAPLLPFIPRPSWRLTAPANEPLPDIFREWVVELQGITVFASASPEASWWQAWAWYHWIWLVGGLFFLGRLLWGYWQLYRLFRQANVSRSDGLWQLAIPALATPFSYGPCLFWPAEANKEEENWRAIWAHERAHIRQGHSYDLLLNELLICLFWWHPMPHLFRRSLRLQHEFLADAAALESTTAYTYTHLLLKQNLHGYVPVPSHAFHHSSIKHRIMMLTSSSKRSHWKLLAIFPLLLALLWACEKENDLIGSSMTETEAELAKKAESESDKFEVIRDTIVTYDPATFAESIEVVERLVYTRPNKMPVYGDCQTEISVGDDAQITDCSNMNLLKDIYSGVKYPALAREAGAEGMVVLSFIVPANGGPIEEVKIARSPKGSDLAIASEAAAYQALDQEALRAVRELPGTWQAGQEDGKAVNVRFHVPIHFKLQ